MRPYEIWIDGYYHMSGGIRALHVLRDELRARGLDAWMKYERRDSAAIGVYPEIVAANPEGYERIVRWLLNEAVLPDDGLTFAWDEGLGEFPLLRVDIIEKDLWLPFDGPRSGTAYWVGKGTVDPALIPQGAVQISRGNFPHRPDLAAFIRSLDYLVSFDPFTAVTLEATLCGTPVVIPVDGGRWHRHPKIRHGIAWGFDELEQARDTVGLAFADYEKQRAVFSRSIDDFARDTQEAYG